MKSKSQTDISEIKERLSGAGLKATPQRLAIFGLVLKAMNHPTAEQIFKELELSHPGISLGTVYKTLDSLVEAKLVKKVKTDDVFRFDAKLHPHSHLYCSRTGSIIDYEDAELHNLIENYFRGKSIPDFQIEEVQVHISGERVGISLDFKGENNTLNKR